MLRLCVCGSPWPPGLPGPTASSGRFFPEKGGKPPLELGHLRRATTIFSAVDGAAAGVVAIADPIKETTPGAIQRLHDMGVKVVMATGDNPQTAKAVAERLLIDEVHAGLKPEDKQRLVEDLKERGAKVAMAGDGINDAPALAAADVGIAMGTGTDVAIQSAGLTLVK